ncbi:MAG: hypothetical protein KGL13_06735 [Gammaproteobacteria bacterium]|nr:hypothetical protein [Gammaproteobacteria bacterium]MDE2346146.1 hypothetical protein [Gammaproteobacteria bacterium]
MNVPAIQSSSSDTGAVQFQRSGYTVQRAAISPESAQLISVYALLQQQWPGYYEPEPMYVAAHGHYADALTETLLLELKPVMERATGLELLPCYSYLRIYGKGAVLHKHLDRPSCEVSCTLTLGFKSESLWPICLHADSQDKSLALQPGDMLVYRGADVPHWRDTFEGEYWVQTFLHYVDAHGQYTDFKLDGRQRIGPFDRRTMQREFKRPASISEHNKPPVTVGPDAPCPCGSGLRVRDCHGKNLSG